MNFVNIVNLCIGVCLIALEDGTTANTDTEQDECNYNTECADHEICVNNHCFDACSLQKCGIRGEPCGAINHTATCTCTSGFERNKDGVCEPLCDDDDGCGQNAECKQVGTKTMCQCKSGYYVDSHFGTECMKRRSCTINHDCNYYEMCKGNFCVTKCAEHNCSKPHETCFPTEDGEQCVCQSGYKYDLRDDCMEVECYTTLHCVSPKICRIMYGMHLCVCPRGYVVDNSDFTPKFSERPCRQSCKDTSDCPKGNWCRGDFCVDCDNIMCPKLGG